MSVTATVLGCALLVVCAGAPSDRVKKVDSGKKLRNVIITSFGELPYEPVESGGFFHADIFPVNLNDDDQQQTMDVALRTGILVEDPNETKTLDEDEDISIEADVTSTNTKRQVINDDGFREVEKIKETEDEFVSPRVQNGYRKPKGNKVRQAIPTKVPLSSQMSFFESRQKVPYSPPSTDSIGFNIDREYYGELGDGWSLQDAEEILKGRNYNILIQNPNSYHVPSPKEIPPPLFFPPQTRHPNFYPFPSFPHLSFGIHHPAAYSASGEIFDARLYRQADTDKEGQGGRSIYKRQDVPSRREVGSSVYQPTLQGAAPHTQDMFYRMTSGV